MGKLAVYKFAYFVSIVFTLFVFALSAFAVFSGNIAPEENMAAAYLSLGKLVLMVVNAALFVYWLIRFRYWAWVPLLALAINYRYVGAMYQPFNLKKQGSGDNLKVLTYNVHSFGGEITGYSAKEFAGILRYEQVDVACFQEYGGNGDFTNEDLKNTYSEHFPYSYLPEGQSQAIYSRYPIRKSAAMKFPKSNNGAIWADIDVNGTVLRVINVHMQTTSFDRMRAKAAQARGARGEEAERQIYLNYTDNFESNVVKRAEQARIIARLIGEAEHPVVLCGDLNDTPGTYTYETMKGNLKDGFMSAGSGYAATYRGMHNLLRIDYVFHSPALKGIKYEVIPYEMSDHNPVCMELSYFSGTEK